MSPASSARPAGSPTAAVRPPARPLAALAVLAAALLGLLAAACQPAESPASSPGSSPDDPAKAAATLTFAVDGAPVRSLDLAAITAASPPQTFTAFDPYYNRPKTFRAVPIEALLAAGFAGSPVAGSLATQEFVLKAQDGYTVPMAGARLLEGGAYVAIADVEVPAWEPIGAQRANPGPFYLVWRGDAQQDLETHPRPWQLARIEVMPFERLFPHTVPTGEAPGSRALDGFQVFKDGCIRCHAINREGGRVGPELNVPQSVVEYRPEEQLKAFIRDPRVFRYSAMPAHPGLRDGDLDALMAYFHAMKALKHDPEANAPGGGAH